VKYIVDVNGERLEVDLDADGIRVDGRRVDARLTDIEGTPVHLVTIDGGMHRVASRRGDARGKYALWMGGYRYEVEALDERTRAVHDLTAAAAVASGPRPLLAPMPGLIVRVHVAVGDTVEVGQGVVVMEAMKMENELRTTAVGVVKIVHVAPGVAVEKGALLIEFH
jgi:pyruvate carboxylase subunit B